MNIYLNNAATTYPKPPGVADAVASFMRSGGANFSRGSTSERDLATMDTVIECRERLASLFGLFDSRFLTFTSGVTESLNVVIKGFLRPGMRVLTSSMEHNAVIRPLRSLEKLGVGVTVIPCDVFGYIDMDELTRAIRQGADMMVMSHASNVCGSVQDLSLISALCSEYSLPLVVDAAQTAGVIDIDVRELGLAALCFTGHKGLLGPQGTGGIAWREDFAKVCAPLIEGGTGSFSHDEHQPDALPDKFESGTMNIPGIAGLLAGVNYIEDAGISEIADTEMRLENQLVEGLLQIPGLVLHGMDHSRERTAVIAMNFEEIDNASAAQILSSEYGIETRPGLHCSPLGHSTLGTLPGGALRLSPGCFNTPEEMDYTLDALKKIAASVGR